MNKRLAEILQKRTAQVNKILILKSREILSWECTITAEKETRDCRMISISEDVENEKIVIILNFFSKAQTYIGNKRVLCGFCETINVIQMSAMVKWLRIWKRSKLEPKDNVSLSSITHYLWFTSYVLERVSYLILTNS